MSQEKIILDWKASQEDFKNKATQIGQLDQYYDTHLECWFTKVGTSWIKDSNMK